MVIEGGPRDEFSSRPLRLSAVLPAAEVLPHGSAMAIDISGTVLRCRHVVQQ
jgi:hypothetical protein